LFILELAADRSRYYNLSNVGNDRLWLQNLLLDNDDSDDPDDVVTEEDLHIMIQLHLYKKKYQKQFLSAKNVNYLMEIIDIPNLLCRFVILLKTFIHFTISKLSI